MEVPSQTAAAWHHSPMTRLPVVAACVVVVAPDFRRRLGGRDVAMLGRGQEKGVIDVEPEDYGGIF